DLAGDGQRVEQPGELRGGGKRRSAAAEEDRLERGRERGVLELELGEERIHIASVVAGAADEGDEVAVPAAVGAERQVDVQVPHATRRRDTRTHRRGSCPRLSTARKASCGTSTIPTCFIRFLPAFCFSSSLRFRVMSPP